MRKRRAPSIEWHIAESEAEWAELQARAGAAAPQPKRRYRWVYGVALLLAVVVGGWWWRTPPVDQPTPAPAPPPGIQWGAPAQLTTAHFVFHFTQRDAQTVATMAPRLERFYSTVQQDFGVANDPTTAPLLITLTTTRTVATAPYRPRVFTALAVPSPALYPATTWSETDLLQQSLVLLLIDHTLAHAVRQHRIGAARYSLLDGLRLWQLWQAELPLGRWRTELVRWIYIDLPATPADAPFPLPQHYTAFCTAHALWMTHPVQIRVPLLCTGFDQSPARLPRTLVQTAPRTLPPLDTPIYPDEQVDAHGATQTTRHPGHALAVATVVDYVSQRYGRDRVPHLVAAWGRYATWDELIPALFGVSATTFETEWQATLDRALDIKTAKGTP